MFTAKEARNALAQYMANNTKQINEKAMRYAEAIGDEIKRHASEGKSELLLSIEGEYKLDSVRNKVVSILTAEGYFVGVDFPRKIIRIQW